uniref:Uncharacterized protein n=1 Tax=Moniliophthora roreri TaxID=221103 RepID=A0A0W0FZ31_MONRR
MYSQSEGAELLENISTENYK